MGGLWLGVDEAGRGPVLGPLVVCGCAVDARGRARLETMGLKDSKALPAAVRGRLAPAIRDAAAGVFLRVLSPADVDAARTRNGLNELEARAMADIVREAEAERVWVDGLTARPRAWGRVLEALALPARPRIVTESKADTRYPVVMAAAILAKVERDAAIARLAAEHGEIGSGYPGDHRTRAFLERCAAGWTFPAFVRRSWLTVTRITGPAGAERVLSTS